MVDERKKVPARKAGKKTEPPKVQRAAQRLRQLRTEHRNDFKAISAELRAEGLPDLAVAPAQSDESDVSRGHPDPDELGKGIHKMVMTQADILDRVNEAQTLMESRFKYVMENLQNVAASSLRRSEDFDQKLTTVGTQVQLLMQLLNRIDPGRLDQAVEALQKAKAGYERPPLRQAAHEAAREIKAGTRPPRRKLGVTIDGSLWAAVEKVQLAQRCTISQILDDALGIWLEHVGDAES